MVVRAAIVSILEDKLNKTAYAHRRMYAEAQQAGLLTRFFPLVALPSRIFSDKTQWHSIAVSTTIGALIGGDSSPISCPKHTAAGLSGILTLFPFQLQHFNRT